MTDRWITLREAWVSHLPTAKQHPVVRLKVAQVKRGRLRVAHGPLEMIYWTQGSMLDRCCFVTRSQGDTDVCFGMMTLNKMYESFGLLAGYVH